MPSVERKLMDEAEQVEAVKRLSAIAPSDELASSENLAYLLLCCPIEQQTEILELFRRATVLRGEWQNA